MDEEREVGDILVPQMTLCLLTTNKGFCPLNHEEGSSGCFELGVASVMLAKF